MAYNPITAISQQTFLKTTVEKMGYVPTAEQKESFSELHPIRKATSPSISGTARISSVRDTYGGSARLSIPTRITDFIGSPLIALGKTSVDFWRLAIGSPEQVAETAVDYLPVSESIKTPIEKAMIEESITTDTPINASGVEGVDINFPEIKLPDIIGGLSEIGKWLLIGGLAIGGVYIAGKYLGRSKK